MTTLCFQYIKSYDFYPRFGNKAVLIHGFTLIQLRFSSFDCFYKNSNYFILNKNIHIKNT